MSLTDPIIGEIIMFAGVGKTPQGFMLCDGRELKIADHTPLFTIIGHAYTPKSEQTLQTFRIPDFRSVVPVCPAHSKSTGQRYPERWQNEEHPYTHVNWQNFPEIQAPLTVTLNPSAIKTEISVKRAKGSHTLVDNAMLCEAKSGTDAAAIFTTDASAPGVSLGGVKTIISNNGTDVKGYLTIGSKTPYPIPIPFIAIGYYIAVEGNFPILD
ncbi:phage tail protein [Sphingomonas sanguinis]|uniref:phage tail protein n=1 Tax=Sphingomonas sanguinis TaxID=33051 RepID=UPI0009EAA498|nr:tail fiber protein [Sphingomonas sanguinis]